jgi:hypothetical protein
MKSIAKPTRIEKAGSQGARESGLIELLCNEKGRRYFGRAFALKAEILSAMRSGYRSQSSIAGEYGVSKQAVGRLVKKARAIYGPATEVS